MKSCAEDMQSRKTSEDNSQGHGSQNDEFFVMRINLQVPVVPMSPVSSDGPEFVILA